MKTLICSSLFPMLDCSAVKLIKRLEYDNTILQKSTPTWPCRLCGGTFGGNDDKSLLLILASDILLVLGYLALADMGEAIVLGMLAHIQTHTLALGAHTHGDEAVYEPIAQIAHAESVDNDNSHGQQVVEEDHEALPRAGYQALLDEDAGEHSAENTARAVGGKHVEGIVYTAVAAPVHGHIADDGDDKGDEDALPHGDIAGRGGDGHQTDHTSHSRTHGRGLAAAQAVEEDPGHHGRGRSGVGVEEGLDGLTVGMERTAGIESEPPQPQHGGAEEHEGDVGGLRLPCAGCTATEEKGSGKGCHTR